MTTREVTFQVGHLLHPKQQQVQQEFRDHRFGVLVAGRRWRKTSLGVLLCLDVASQGGRAWWLAPIYEQAMIGWRMMTPLARQIIASGVALEIREGDHSINFPNGGVIRVRSTDNPDSLRGEGLDLAVCDEAAMMKETVWTEALRPALSDRQGKALFISTPKGRNWFWRLYSDAETRDGWARWQFPSWTNPGLARPEIDQARQELPSRVFQQEYAAEFLDDVGAVFRNVDGCIHGELLRPQTGRRYVAGLDLARVNDWTVLTVADTETRKVVHFDRWQLADWGVTYARVAQVCAEYERCPVYVDATGLGDVAVAGLRKAGVRVEPFVLSGDHGDKQGTKTELINALILAIEREQIRYPNIPVLVDELKAYEYKLSKAGNVSTGAPEGYHDDAVISLGLCNWGVLQHPYVSTQTRRRAALTEKEW